MALATTTLQKTMPLLATALLWGVTNPLIKRASERAFVGSSRGQARWLTLLLDWRYVVPLALNLSGSAVFYYALQFADLSIASPVTNALTFVVTVLVGSALGEKLAGGKVAMIGMMLVVIGIVTCVSESAARS